MARETKTLAERNGDPFGVAYEETPDGLSPVQTVREIESAPSIEARLDAIEEALGGTLTTQLTGRNGEQDLQGPIGSRPAANAVPTNSTYFALDEGKLYWTDGSVWAEVGS